MGIVLIDVDAIDFAPEFESPFGAAEFGHPRDGGGHRDTEEVTTDNGREGIEDIMLAGNNQLIMTIKLTFFIDVKAGFTNLIINNVVGIPVIGFV